jgi:predicted RNA-binding protein with PUA-like domain
MKNSQFWLMKSEPDEFSIDDLKRNKTTLWTGVRNYQARNFMKDQMKLGDSILFYHSNAEPPGVAGLAKVSKLNLVDPTQFDKKSDYFDPKVKPDQPRWFCVEVEFEKKFSELLSLAELRNHKPLEDMLLFKKGQRLSIQPVTQSHFDYICKLVKK